MIVENIKLSQEARDKLVQLKRRTGIKHWNVLCRWALCRSLAEPTRPQAVPTPADSSVEMTWRVFAGTLSDAFVALLRMRCHEDGMPLTDETLASQFRLHLHRGISYLAADRQIQDVAGLIEVGLKAGAADDGDQGQAAPNGVTSL